MSGYEWIALSFDQAMGNLEEYGLKLRSTICSMTDEPCADPSYYESGCKAEREEELG